MKKAIMLVLAVSALQNVEAQNIGQELIVNGNFAKNECYKDWCIFKAPNRVRGWNPKPEIEIGFGKIYNSKLGRQRVIDLASNMNTCVDQNIGILLPGVYQLKYEYAASQGRSFEDCQFRVSFNDRELKHTTPRDYNVNTDVLEFEVKVGCNGRVEFCGVGGKNNSYGAIIRTVSLIRKAYPPVVNPPVTQPQSPVVRSDVQLPVGNLPVTQYPVVQPGVQLPVVNPPVTQPQSPVVELSDGILIERDRPWFGQRVIPGFGLVVYSGGRQEFYPFNDERLVYPGFGQGVNPGFGQGEVIGGYLQEDNPGFGQGGVIRGDGQEAKPGFGQGVDSSFAGFPSSQGSQTSGNQVLNPAFGSSINQLGNLRH